MKIPFFNSFFKKRKTALHIPDSIVVKKLKQVSEENGFLFFQDITIYHHTKQLHIPILIYAKNRGIYIFEYKEWSYDDLKNATVQKANNQEESEESLSYENRHDFIKQRFNELMHGDGVEIYNFLIMENLDSNEYHHLDDSFKDLLPKKRVLFNNSARDEILKKLNGVSDVKEDMPQDDTVLASLFVQYSVLDAEDSLFFASKQQRNFIDENTLHHQTLSSLNGTGKSSALVLKAIIYSLQNPSEKIAIISPTLLSCDRLREQLLNTLERAIVEINLDSIEVLTPRQLLNKHLKKLRKYELKEKLIIEDILMQKPFDFADMLLCDDIDLIEDKFLEYLVHIQKNAKLIVFKNAQEESQNSFDIYFKTHHSELQKLRTNPHAKALQLISNALKEDLADEILVVSGSLSKEKLQDDLEFFIKDKAILLDSSKGLLDLQKGGIYLCEYKDISSLKAKTVILLDPCSASKEQLRYAQNIASKNTYILYEEDCENIDEMN